MNKYGFRAWPYMNRGWGLQDSARTPRHNDNNNNNTPPPPPRFKALGRLKLSLSWLSGGNKGTLNPIIKHTSDTCMLLLYKFQIKVP